jgi:DNA-binding transcriptional MocR family regulator
MDFETTVKMEVYRTIAETAKVPSSPEVARALGASPGAVEEAFLSLRGRRLLFLEPGDPLRIRMAPPFSGIETPFPVQARGKIYYANCVWDAYGVAAALDEDAVVEASDGWTGEPIVLEVKDQRPVPRQDCVAHFAVPAAHWWDDLIYT